jgi:hypothetical protein
MHTDVDIREASSQYVGKNQNRQIGMFSLIGFSHDIAVLKETKKNKAVFI